LLASAGFAVLFAGAAGAGGADRLLSAFVDAEAGKAADGGLGAASAVVAFGRAGAAGAGAFFLTITPGGSTLLAALGLLLLPAAVLPFNAAGLDALLLLALTRTGGGEGSRFCALRSQADKERYKVNIVFRQRSSCLTAERE
jgi:hypothetical protein